MVIVILRISICVNTRVTLEMMSPILHFRTTPPNFMGMYYTRVWIALDSFLVWYYALLSGEKFCNTLPLPRINPVVTSALGYEGAQDARPPVSIREKENE